MGESYSCASGGVITAGYHSFFRGGAETGSYNAGTQVWTPGRDASGFVTKASFDLVPTDGTWVEVAGTAFTTQVQPLLSAALPSYNDPGGGDLGAVPDAYNGIAFDVAGGRVFVHGGGHQDSANNGIYRCDLKKLTWAIAKLPDMQTYWPAGYRSNPPTHTSYSGYDRAVDAVSADPTTTTFWQDEFYDTVEPLANTRNPTARHTYSAMTFYNGKLRHGVRRYWEWDEVTNTWSAQFPLGKNASTHQQPGGGYCGEQVKGTWDEVNNCYICGPVQISGVPQGFWKYNAGNNTFSNAGGLLSSWNALDATACRMGRKWVFFIRPLNDNSYFWPPSLSVHDLDSSSSTGVGITGLTQSRCVHSTRYDESTSMEYVGANGLIFCLMPYDAADAFSPTQNLPLEPFWINPATGVMTHEPQTGKFPALWSDSLLKNKMFYIPQIKALAIMPSSGSNMRIRRFA